MLGHTGVQYRHVDLYYLHENRTGWLPAHTSFSVTVSLVWVGVVFVSDFVVLFLSTVYRTECDQRGWPDGGAAHVLPGRRAAVSAARGAVPQPGSSGRAGGSVGGLLYTVSSTTRHCFLTSLIVSCGFLHCSLWNDQHKMLSSFRDTRLISLWFRTSGQFIKTSLRHSQCSPSMMIWLRDTAKAKAEY